MHYADPASRAQPKSAFAERFRHECDAAIREDRPISIALVDIDHFKSINDAFGHGRGDEILEEFTQRLSHCLRETDFVFRFGGDEFVLLLPGAGKEAARGFAERLLQRVQSTPFLGEPPVSLSLSVGVASAPDDEGISAELLTLADHRLLAAKRLGRGRVIASDTARPEEVLADESGRLIEREAARDSALRFLNSLPSRRRAGLAVRGPSGSGRSRFLREVAHAATLLGYRTVLVSGRAAVRDRAFDALLSSREDFGGIVPIPGSELDLPLAELIQAAGERGLVVLIDNLPEVDEATLDMLARLQRTRRLQIVGLVVTLDPYGAVKSYLPDASIVDEITLEPLTREGTRTWLRTLLRHEPNARAIDLIYAASGGLPRLIRIALEEIPDLGTLVTGGRIDVTLGALRESIEVRTQLPPCQLPATPYSIVGRSREIEEGKRLLSSSRLMTLLGPGGMGKTRLALQVARELADSFEQGVFFVPLGENSNAEFLATAIANGLGLQIRSGTELKVQLYDYLRSKSLLLVLDNLDHMAEQATALVSELLTAAPDLRILVTSRERLHLYEEVVVTVTGLAFPRSDLPEQALGYPAVQLFMQRARKITPRFTPAEDDLRSIARICEAVEGMPLALEMAAALTRVLSCQEIEQHIGAGFDALSTPLRDVAERHRSLRTVVESSWAFLSEDEQLAARRLSIFPRDFTVDAALSLDVQLPTLLALADKSILRRTVAGRFEMHRVLRQFVHEKLVQQPGEYEKAAKAFTGYYAHFLQARRETLRTRGYHTALDQITAEIENVRSAWRQAIARDEQAFLRMCIDTLFDFYDKRVHYRDAQELFGWANALPHSADVLGAALSRYAYFCLRTSDVASARAALRRSHAIARSSGDTRELAFASRVAAELARSRGKYRAATRILQSAVEGFRTVHSTYDLAVCLNDLGLTEWARGRNARAQRHISASLRLRRDIGDEVGVVKCLMNLAILADIGGQSGEAEKLFAESLKLSRELGDRRNIALNLHNLAVFIQLRAEQSGDHGRVRQAEQMLMESLRISRDTGERRQICHTLCALGDIALLKDDRHSAAYYYHEAVMLAAELGAPPLQSRTLIGMAALLLRTGQAESAHEVLTVIALQRTTDESDRAKAQTLLAQVREHMESPLDERPLPGLDELARRYAMAPVNVHPLSLADGRLHPHQRNALPTAG